MQRLKGVILFLVLGLFSLPGSLLAAGLAYPLELAQWEPVATPGQASQSREWWWMDEPDFEMPWTVFIQNGKACARLEDGLPNDRVPGFIPMAEFSRATQEWIVNPNSPGIYLVRRDHQGYLPTSYCQPTASAKVDDGWLIAYNKGEFGSTLYWFSFDGRSRYKVADLRIRTFFTHPEGVYALEGLAHISLSMGSVVRFSKDASDHHWKAHTWVTLPAAPETVAVYKDGTLLIALSESLISIGRNRQMRTLWAYLPWRYSHSAALSADERLLYIGLEYCVAELDLAKRTLRFLAPPTPAHFTAWGTRIVCW